VIAMKSAFPSGPFAFAIVGLAALALAGCNDDVVHVEDGPPAVPTGVTTITGDGQVQILWYPVREDDVAGYGVYRSFATDGRYDRIATVHGVENTSLVDDSVTNGVTYYYAVDAFDRAGHESALSYEDAFDTPRPAGTGVGA
jgi:fibronectin type 3 domain-containing protein